MAIQLSHRVSSYLTTLIKEIVINFTIGAKELKNKNKSTKQKELIIPEFKKVIEVNI